MFRCPASQIALLARSAFGIGLILLGSACGVRKAVIPTSVNFQQARTLSRSELADYFQRLTTEHQSLIVKSTSLTFMAESLQNSKREKFPSTSGILVITRSGDLRLQIMAPVIKTTLVDIAARGGNFELWYPRNKTLYRGEMNEDLSAVTLAADEADKSPRYNLAKLRPWHITQTFFHARLASDSTLLINQEDTAIERYYVLQEIGRSPSGELILLQKLWLERSSLSIRRKVLYDSDGAPVSEIDYRTITPLPNGAFPFDISLKRPQEGYQVQFQIKKMELDPPIRPEMFELSVPEGATVKDTTSK